MASVPGASFTGLAIANTRFGASYLYAADQNSGNVDVFNSQWKMVGKLDGSQWPSRRFQRI